jgi:hypothetical protein
MKASTSPDLAPQGPPRPSWIGMADKGSATRSDPAAQGIGRRWTAGSHIPALVKRVGGQIEHV